jgi:hypothetical protein
MARLSRRQPLCRLLYSSFYVDLYGALFILLLVPDVAIFYLLIPLAGWLLLILVARRIILASHDYSFSDTMPRDQRDDRLKPILQRGIDEDTFPKTHRILICNMCIFVGIIVCRRPRMEALVEFLSPGFLCLFG